MNNQNQKQSLIKSLNQYFPIVSRVHGSHHPEIVTVKDLYYHFIKQEQPTSLDVSTFFNQVRDTTNNYQVFDDVCESYQAIYRMLKQLEQEYVSK